MPKEITLDDGTKETVYTEEDVKGLQAGSDKNKERKETLTNLNKSLDLKEGETFDDKIKEMKELANPNFAKYRAKSKADASKLKELGFQHDENGNLTSDTQPLSSDEISKQISEKVATEVKSITNSSVKEEALSKFTQEDRDVIKPHLDKLMNEYPNDLKENVAMAVQKAFPSGAPDQVKATLSSVGGHAPNINISGKKSEFTGSEEGKQMLSDILPADVKKALADKEK